MSLSMLKVCGRKLTPVTTQPYLPYLSVANYLLDKRLHAWESSFLTLNSLSKQKRYLGLQQPKFCSSSVRENLSPMKQMKERMNQYIDIIYKGSDLNFAHVTVVSKDLLKAIKTDVSDLKSCPTPPLVIGFGSLIPFIAAPMHFIMSTAFAPGVAYGQLAYGAVFLSFLGGIRWGVALANPKWDNLIKSITPSLIGWSSLLLPHWLGCFTLSAGLISMVISDRKHPHYQPWFRSLRVAVTTIAVLSVAGSLFLCLILPASKN